MGIPCKALEQKSSCCLRRCDIVDSTRMLQSLHSMHSSPDRPYYSNMQFLQSRSKLWHSTHGIGDKTKRKRRSFEQPFHQFEKASLAEKTELHEETRKGTNGHGKVLNDSVLQNRPRCWRNPTDMENKLQGFIAQIRIPNTERSFPSAAWYSASYWHAVAVPLSGYT